MKDGITGKTALVTGASGGLGVEFAHQLAKRGCNVILTARREPLLRELQVDLEKHYGIAVSVIVADLSTENAGKKLYLHIKSRNLEVDILINNAGFGMFGEFADLHWDRELNMLKLDMITLTHLTKLFVQDMIYKNFGCILQVSSIGAYQPTPTYATYSAAKSYVLNFGQALNYELRHTGVSCTVLSPGITRTGFLEVAGQKPSLYQRLMMMESDRVAEIGIEAMLKRKYSVIPGLMNKLTVWSMKLLPDPVKAAMAYTTMTTGQKKIS